MKKLFCIFLVIATLTACVSGISAGAINVSNEINDAPITRALKSGYVAGNGVNLRSDHRLSAPSLGLLYRGDTFSTDNVPEYQDALAWLNVIMEKTTEKLEKNKGWVAKDYVVVVG